MDQMFIFTSIGHMRRSAEQTERSFAIYYGRLNRQYNRALILLQVATYIRWRHQHTRRHGGEEGVHWANVTRYSRTMINYVLQIERR